MLKTSFFIQILHGLVTCFHYALFPCGNSASGQKRVLLPHPAGAGALHAEQSAWIPAAGTAVLLDTASQMLACSLWRTVKTGVKRQNQTGGPSKLSLQQGQG